MTATRLPLTKRRDVHGDVSGILPESCLWRERST